jgi:hypothetical protein
MWQLAVFPLLPLPIPGTPVVIPVPIVSDRDIRRVEPSAIVSKHHIAPAPIVEAAHHLDRLIGIELHNHWIAVVGTCIDVYRTCRNRVLRSSGSGQGEQIHAKAEAQATWGSHSVPPKL